MWFDLIIFIMIRTDNVPMIRINMFINFDRLNLIEETEFDVKPWSNAIILDLFCLLIPNSVASW